MVSPLTNDKKNRSHSSLSARGRGMLPRNYFLIFFTTNVAINKIRLTTYT